MAKNHQFARPTTANKTSALSKHKIKMVSLSLLGVSALVLWYLQQSNAPHVLHQQTYTTPVAQKFIDQPAGQRAKSTLQLPNLKKADKTKSAPNKPVDISLSEQRMLQNKPASHPESKQPIKLSVHESNNAALPVPAPAPAAPAPALAAPAQTPASPPVPAAKTTTGTEAATTPISAKSPQPTEQKSAQNISATGFTLQLIGVHDKAKIIEFKKQQNLGDKASYFETTLQGSAWYVLTYGQYKTADDAHAAIKTLPLTVQAQKPWVKPLSAIHSPLIR